MPTSAHRQRPRARLVALVSVLAMLLGGGATAAADDHVRSRSDAEADVELHLARLHAQARSEPGAFGSPGQEPAPELTWSEEVAVVARAWSDELAADGELAHNVGWVEEQGSAGENVQYLHVRTDRSGWRREAAERLLQGWMDSDDHRDVLLHDAFDEFGVGVTIAEAEGALVTVYASVPFRSGDGDLVRPADQLRSIDAACPTDAALDSGLRDIDGDTHARAIECLLWWQIAQGATASTFDPGRVVTRAQLATLVAEAITTAGGELTPAQPRFDDVAPGSTHAEAIGALAAAGLIDGYDDGTFQPGAAVERGQLARFLVGAFEHVGGSVPSGASQQWFSDTAGSTHEQAIERAVEAGWVAGYADGRYRPADPVRRGQLATFLARWLDGAVAAGLAEPPTSP